ncbi:MAG TPA: hypothetical protein GXX33_03115 [Firmicutes bacterium]|uniref:Dipeptidase n=1 Tax=Capillibacterium thermochitinicola TaxID=2699427 RepID=A0A8J6HZK5_9FIRM|nr:dipeptidase [Capillibacterium thermochitinicola]MBA2132039.1 dipeptidase [Capillibacterium thermochitinicola]HHW11977.1 hypothetical protein [Bacillota bacterium]
MRSEFGPILDGHADTLVRIMEDGGSLGHAPHLQLDIPRLKKAGVWLQVLAVCAGERPAAYAWAKTVITRWRQEYHRWREELIWIRSRGDFEAWHGGKKIGVILALEGLEPLEGELSRLEEFYEAGVRMFSLTWNGANPFACGVGVPEDRGLTPLGKAVVRMAEERGMILDLSHLGRKSFIDLIDLARQPVCVSHANVDPVHAHRRNLTAEQIRLVAATGGTVGLTFYPPFIGAGAVGSADLIPHLEALLEIGGMDCPALGSDFDGIDCTPTDLPDVSSLPVFLHGLAAAGYGREIIRKVAGGNFYRFLRDKFAVTN